MIDISIVLSTFGHNEEAQKVIREIPRGEGISVYVASHGDSFIKGIQDFTWIDCPERGSSKSFDYVIRNIVKDEWIVYLCDDCEFPDKRWINELRDSIKSSPNIGVIGFNDKSDVNGIIAPIGCLRRSWYLEKYPLSNPYKNYFWDSELSFWAKRETLWLHANNVNVNMKQERPVSSEAIQEARKIYDDRERTHQTINGKVIYCG